MAWAIIRRQEHIHDVLLAMPGRVKHDVLMRKRLEDCLIDALAERRGRLAGWGARSHAHTARTWQWGWGGMQRGSCIECGRVRLSIIAIQKTFSNHRASKNVSLQMHSCFKTCILYFKMQEEGNARVCVCGGGRG